MSTYSTYSSAPQLFVFKAVPSRSETKPRPSRAELGYEVPAQRLLLAPPRQEALPLPEPTEFGAHRTLDAGGLRRRHPCSRQSQGREHHGKCPHKHREMEIVKPSRLKLCLKLSI